MKFLHTGDLHIGKMVNGFSMLQDQKKALTQMVEIAKREHVQAFIIAGDVYDRAIPTAEAVLLFNDFLNELHQASILVFCISGNHDSPERLGFMKQVLKDSGIYIAGVYENCCRQVSVADEYGEVVFVLMPFVKPHALLEKTSQAAVEKMLEDTFLDKPYDSSKRYVLITHYFVAGDGKSPELSDSETISSVGGLDSVNASLFSKFAYTALGHIHKPQRMGENIYYAGSPLPYSFSECEQEKSIVLVSLGEQGVDSAVRMPIEPLHRMRKIRGKLENLISDEVVSLENPDDYLYVTLTDEMELIDPMGTLRAVYPNVMQMSIEKNRIRDEEEYVFRDVKEKAMAQLFEEFFTSVTDRELDDSRKEVMNQIFTELERE